MGNIIKLFKDRRPRTRRIILLLILLFVLLLQVYVGKGI
jgi:hypothetical protein